MLGMSRLLVLLAWLAFFTLPARAEPPRLADCRPAGLKRGMLAELTLSGTGLQGHPRLVAPFGHEIEGEGVSSEDGKTWTLQIKPQPDAALGLHLIRVQTDDGVSNLFPIEIGQLPQTLESEPNDSPEAAQAVETPVVIEGRAEGSDVDYYRFKGKQGQRLVIDARCARIGSGLDPQVRLSTAERRFLAASDDALGLATDAFLITTLPQDADYLIEISDTRYQGSNRPVYRLLVGDLSVATELYPLGGQEGDTVGFELSGGTLAEMAVTAAHLAPGAAMRPFPSVGTPRAEYETEVLPTIEVGRIAELREPSTPSGEILQVVPPITVNGRLRQPGEEDRFRVVVGPGQKLRISLTASSLGSPLDGVLRVLNPKGAQIANSDDTTIKALDLPGQKKPPDYVVSDPSLEVDVPADVTDLTVVVRDLQERGGPGYGYRLCIEQAVPGFNLQLGEAELSIPRGGDVQLPVAIERVQGFNGPVKLALAEVPTGVKVRGGVVAEGQNVGWLSFSAGEAVENDLKEVRLIGTAAGPASEITSAGNYLLTVAELSGIPLRVLPIGGLALAPASAREVRFEVADETVLVPHGQEVSVPARIGRDEKGKVELTLTAQPLPKGMGAPEVKAAADKDEAEFKINASPETPLGLSSVAFIARGKVDGKDQVFAAPVVNVEVVAPVALELSAPVLELRAGESARLQGKVLRRGTFQELVVLKLDALPAGVTAEPVTVATDQVEFSLELKAEASAEAGEKAVPVVLGFKIGDKDYPFPATPVTLKVVKP